LSKLYNMNSSFDYLSVYCSAISTKRLQVSIKFAFADLDMSSAKDEFVKNYRKVGKPLKQRQHFLKFRIFYATYD
jgi:hypothetical protein